MSSSSLLWLLQPPQGQPRWLFGSMHIRDDRVYQFVEKLQPFISEADVFVGEMELDVRNATMPMPDYNLKEYIVGERYDKMRSQYLKSFNLDLERYVQVHPMLILSAVSQSLFEAEHHVSLDEHLWHYAKGKGKQVQGIESYEEQFQLLHGMDPAPLYQQLYKLSKSPSGMRKQTQRALTWYMKSDIHQLFRLTKSSMHGFRKPIVYERNKVMVRRIAQLSDDQKFFIVIGAGHLSGKSGILSLLKKEGFRISPMQLRG